MATGRVWGRFFYTRIRPVGPSRDSSPHAQPSLKSETQISIYDFSSQNHKHKHESKHNHKHKHRNHKHKFQIYDFPFQNHKHKHKSKHNHKHKHRNHKHKFQIYDFPFQNHKPNTNFRFMIFPFKITNTNTEIINTNTNSHDWDELNLEKKMENEVEWGHETMGEEDERRKGLCDGARSVMVRTKWNWESRELCQCLIACRLMAMWVRELKQLGTAVRARAAIRG